MRSAAELSLPVPGGIHALAQVQKARFALNHMAAPHLDIDGFFALSARLGCFDVEIRNDIAGQAILDGTSPDVIRAAAARHGQKILTINALQRFNDWSPTRAAEAEALAKACAQTGAAALILVPRNDGTGCGDGERKASLAVALRGLAPILERHAIMGFVEPLGFDICSLSLKSEAAEVIHHLGLRNRFRLTHDTFHHHLAGETATFPDLTGLIHISGVTDRGISLSDMRDSHRVLVDADDRIGNIAQIRVLLDAGVTVPCSFEPFSAAVHDSTTLPDDLSASMTYIRTALA